ncbi:MAG: TlpA family protein disulfide reductase [Acidobacteria bacterium]|nr:TlpA family protein disulfide reductase [Acidobacteriota bacterium]
MRSHLAALAVLAAATAASVGCRPAAAPVSVSNRPVSINDRPTTNVPRPPSKPLTEMSWTFDDDRVQKLADLRGKVVILDFWATNCPPCREEIPHLNELAAKYGPENLQIIGLHVGDRVDRAEIPAFRKEVRLDYPIGFPEDALMDFIFAERSNIPQTAVFDRNGTLIKKFVGFSSAIGQEIEATVENAVTTTVQN